MYKVYYVECCKYVCYHIYILYIDIFAILCHIQIHTHIYIYMIWYDMIWYDMVWYDMIWYDMIWYDMLWYDMIWYDMIWYDMCFLRTSHSCDLDFFTGLDMSLPMSLVKF